jgi:hypothetical protein
MKCKAPPHILPAGLVACVVLAAAISTFGGPVRPVTSGQFIQQAPAPNGPPPDPLAQRGQWFVNVTNAFESPRKWELHDNDDALCIRGSVVSIQWGVGMTLGMTNIAGFSILATVVNNLSATNLPAGVATNSHSEMQAPPQPRFWGPMFGARIAAEFAVAEAGPAAPPLVGIAPNPPNMSPPYYYDPRSQGQYVIEAQNEDLAAWYCFLGADPQNPANPAGAYYVPAWELGDIPQGGSAQVLMHFTIKAYGGGPAEMPATDIRHGVLRHSLMNGSDVLYARDESLKISHWIDLILVDYGWVIQSVPGQGEEPAEYVYASDVSVFFNTVAPADRPALRITPVLNNQTLSAVQLNWTASDAGPYLLQYCDNLASNVWKPIPLSLPLPPIVPGLMNWTDNGTLPLPPLDSARFYRLYMP